MKIIISWVFHFKKFPENTRQLSKHDLNLPPS